MTTTTTNKTGKTVATATSNDSLAAELTSGPSSGNAPTGMRTRRGGTKIPSPLTSSTAQASGHSFDMVEEITEPPIDSKPAPPVTRSQTAAGEPAHAGGGPAASPTVETVEEDSDDDQELDGDSISGLS